MTNEAHAKIQKMLYNLSTNDRASASKELRQVLEMKVKDAYNREYTQVSNSLSKENK
jgi:hypothetical protein